MNIIEAVKSGRRVRRKDWRNGEWAEPRGDALLVLLFDILADDWEVEPVKKEISAEDVRRAYRKWGDRPIVHGMPLDAVSFIIQELGLE